MSSENRIRPFALHPMVWIIGCLVFLFPQVAMARAPAVPKRIVAIYWYDRDFPANVALDGSFKAALHSAPDGDAEYYAEYVDSNRFPGEHQSEALHDYLRNKYADRNIDVVVAFSDVALQFLLKYRSDLFTHSPIVFVAIKRPATTEPASGPGLTGIVRGGGYKQTLDLALRLHPGTKQVFIVSGTLDHDKQYETLCRQELQGFDSGISINYLTDLPLDELMLRMKSLPQRSVVLYIWQQSRGGQDRVLESPDVLAAIAPSTKAPIYGVASWQVGRGIVGGYLRTFEADGKSAAEITLRIANGARAQDIPIESSKTVPMFDWGEVRRWAISEELLPPDSVMLNRRPTVWESFKGYIIGGIALIFLQTLLILALLRQRARRRKAEAQRQLAAEALSRVSRKLIRAQEQERKRIARELHDDLGQELAFMKVTIDSLLENSHASLKASLTDLSTQLSAIAETTREISHGLYPTQLEYLGLPKALSKLRDEVQRGNDLSVRLRVGALEENLQPATSLSLYRVAQETLHNIVTHSRARSVQVELTTENGHILLRVVDDGIGFDVNQERSGLGLASMRERVLALGGSIDISSSQTKGTTVEVRVPLQEASANLSSPDRSQMR